MMFKDVKAVAMSKLPLPTSIAMPNVTIGASWLGKFPVVR
jgi:hypothetical protein